ncbi:Dps family protein [Paenibacillus senegalensis]|uniref:Dps family protein n=1 Tax=Paenibacillus senegalensis TaxID=1465766 RepID=UPI000288B59A|nr:Dps family protein [Paenibacillus senegalensis]
MPKTLVSVESALNQQVANFSVMYMKLHNYHWNVKGEHFFTLHVKLEELYDEFAQHLDDLAERVLALGGKPVGTLKQCLEMSTLKEASDHESSADMVKQVAQDFEMICKELREGIEAAEENGDAPTADMFTAIAASLEKHGWMLKAYLKA